MRSTILFKTAAAAGLVILCDHTVAVPVSSENPTMIDLLVPISTSGPDGIYPTIQHPELPIYADACFNKTVPTNSWISNLFYPSVNDLAPTTSDPYTFRLLDGYGGNPGLTIRQPSSKVYGSYPAMNDIPPTEVGYMINSVVVDMRFTCSEWGDGTRPTPTVTSWDHLGANLRLSKKSSDQYIDFPLVRGMAYVTGVYHNLTPQFYTQHAIIRFEAENTQGDSYSGYKFKVTMNDTPTSTFLIYALGKEPLVLRKSNGSTITATSQYNGPIRIAKLPSPEHEGILDKSYKVWPVGGNLKAKGNREQGIYEIHWETQGATTPEKLLMYAYPHHNASISGVQKTGLVLESATKGLMTAMQGDRWTLTESRLSPVDWLPLNPEAHPMARAEIVNELDKDLQHDYAAETLLEDNYFSGKGLQKYALLALILNKPDQTQLHNPEMAAISLDKIKSAFLPYLENSQKDPFSYDTVYKGVVSRAGLPKSMGGTGDANAAFGHSYYSDHHYHQGYLIVTAAIIHYLDPTWKTNELVRWTESLIRDVNSPVEDDPHFASFRNWDWFAGHSWAGGIKTGGALDGRDQESVPEAVNFYWGTKLWGLATGNEALANLASLQLAIVKRTTYDYFWMLDNNTIRPKNMIKNKVAGIYFEQKIDYTTYFGRYLEFVHGIQQLPMTPALSDDIRTPEFVAQEWQQKLSTVAAKIQNPWAGVLYLNLALSDPREAFSKLRNVEIDDGQTRSYSLYIAATRPNFTRGIAGVKNHIGKSSVNFRIQDLNPFYSSAVNSIRRLNGTNNHHDDRYNGY